MKYATTGVEIWIVYLLYIVVISSYENLPPIGIKVYSGPDRGSLLSTWKMNESGWLP